MIRRLKIAAKILLLSVTVAFSAILLLSLVADYVVRGAIKRDAFDKLTAVREMNHKRDLHAKLSLLLETTHAELIRGIIDLLHEQAVPPDQTT